MYALRLSKVYGLGVQCVCVCVRVLRVDESRGFRGFKVLRFGGWGLPAYGLTLGCRALSEVQDGPGSRSQYN